MDLSVINVGSYMTNCWLLKDEKTGKALLVDPGFYSEELERFLKRNGVNELQYILITHGHMDHTCGAVYVREKFGGKIVIGEKDAFLLSEYRFISGSYDYENAFSPCSADIEVKDGDELSFGEEKIRIMFTPGHTVGEVCYIINDMLFTGDVLFRGSMGRTDLEGGNLFALADSLKKIGSLQKNYLILPGHGEKSTLDYEKMTNMYLKAACSKK